MKKLIGTFLLIWLAQVAIAQDEPSSQYIFQNFEPATIEFKQGTPIKANLDYNTLREEMLFKQNDTVMILAQVDRIAAVLIKGRRFIPVAALFYEEITIGETKLYIRHLATLTTPAVDTGMGKTTNTGQNAVSSANWVVGGYSFILPAYNVKRKQEYYLKIGNKYTMIKSAKSFDGLFPNQSANIKQFIAENHTDLTQTADLIKLIANFSAK